MRTMRKTNEKKKKLHRTARRIDGNGVQPVPGMQERPMEGKELKAKGTGA